MFFFLFIVMSLELTHMQALRTARRSTPLRSDPAAGAVASMSRPSYAPCSRTAGLAGDPGGVEGGDGACALRRSWRPPPLSGCWGDRWRRTGAPRWIFYLVGGSVDFEWYFCRGCSGALPPTSPLVFVLRFLQVLVFVV